VSAALQAGVVTHSAIEIARVLENVRSRGLLVTAYLGEVIFQSLVLKVDPRGGRLQLTPSPVRAANQALFSRTRCSFHIELPGWHVEFVAGKPRVVAVTGGTKVIELEFPRVLSTHQRRAQPRTDVRPSLVVRCLADAGGITPFEAAIVDISQGGIGFLAYPEDIVLEPGTLLRGCRITLADGREFDVDLEVRYSQPVTMGRRRVMRSGCRFVDPPQELIDLALRYAAK
jgi:c-di-GMP-binding flagellar brake protein YcgR